MRKSLGVKKPRPAAPPPTKTTVAKSTSSQPTYSQPPTAPALFAKRHPTPSQPTSDTADTLALDRLRIASASSSTSTSPAPSPSANSLAALSSNSCILPLSHRSQTLNPLVSDVPVNPFALPATCPSLVASSSAPTPKFDFARPANRSVSKPTNPPPSPPAPSTDKRQRTLSNELHSDRLQAASNPHKSTRSTNTTPAQLDSDNEPTVDNSTFTIPPPPPPPASTTRKSMPDPPRKRKPTASHRSHHHHQQQWTTADDHSHPRTVIDMTVSPLPEKQPFSRFPLFGHGGGMAAAGVKVDTRLLFGSQCSRGDDGDGEEASEKRTMAVDELPAIVYDSQQTDGETEEELSEQLTQPAAPSPSLQPPQSTSSAAALLPPSRSTPSISLPRQSSNVLRQSSNVLQQLRASQSSFVHRTVSGLNRTSSMLSSASQAEEYCTPLDQVVKPRTDEQRNLDLFNSRMLHQSAAATTSVMLATGASSSTACSSSVAISVNTFLPFALRHGSDVDTTRRSEQSNSVDGSVTGSRLLADYVVLETVGEGAFGCVLRCRHRLDGCMYAVKRIKRVSTGHVNRLAELREVWALSALMMAAHPPPSLLLYHGSWLEDHQLHIVTQWCDGPTLALAMTQRRLTEDDVTLLLQHVCGALRHLHALGVAHLDIKPTNILLTTSSSAPPPLSHIQPPAIQYKLLDYGLLTPLSSHPQSLHTCGDRQYVPLYAIEHEDRCDCLDKVDVYMLGMTVLEAIKGRQLTGEERDRVRLGGEVRTVVRCEEGEAEVSERLLSVLEGMLCLDMDQRWDADTVLRQLDSSESRMREFEARVAVLTGECNELQRRCLLAENERDSGREKQAQLEKYLRDVQLHMARLHC